MTRELQDAIETIEEFLDGTGNMWGWDDFLSVPPRDPAVATIQGFCRQLRADYPPQITVSTAVRKEKRTFGCTLTRFGPKSLNDAIQHETSWCIQVPPNLRDQIIRTFSSGRPQNWKYANR